MNNITDITILIAVIALALWPVVLFLLKTINIRKKRLEHLERMTKKRARRNQHTRPCYQCIEKNRMSTRNK